MANYKTTAVIREIREIAEEMIGEWIAVNEIHHPPAIFVWKQIYDLACEADRETSNDEQKLIDVLTPLSFSADELFETATFPDDAQIFLRPDDGNDSVINGWKKSVAFADVRRATRMLNGGE